MVDLEREEGDEQDEDMPPEYEPALTTESVVGGSGTEGLLLPKYRP